MKKILLNLFDYDNNVVRTGVNLCNPNIVKVTIKVISGDEIALVDYVNGVRATYDASERRDYDFFDNEYTLLDRENGIDIIDKFLKRKTSYEIDDCDLEIIKAN